MILNITKKNASKHMSILMPTHLSIRLKLRCVKSVPLRMFSLRICGKCGALGIQYVLLGLI